MYKRQVDYLIHQGVKTIFYPCMSYNLDEHLGDNHYNCPVVAYYPEVIAAIKQIIAKAAAKGVKIGCFADTVEGGKKWRDMGVKFIGYGCDTYIFMQAAKADVAEFDV